ncbi:MAG: SLBB domain-containing protein [Armatimonadota bacterium]|nr:MAG: SLBB domain-containing protein [Armatimonadota bacterium]
MRSIVYLCVALVAAGAVTAQDIVARPGDVLSISVLGEDTLSRQVTVSDDGAIALPLAGDVKVAGQTAAAISRLLTERLSDYIRDPQVTVEISERAPLKVIVSGAVNSPGLFYIACDSRLADALAAGGGPTPEANLSRISHTRAGEKPQMIDFQRFLNEGDEAQNPVVSSGDHVGVAQRPERTCRILGQVVRPGAYELAGDPTPWDLVAQAGGLVPGANPREVVLKPKDGPPQTLDLTAMLEPEAMASAPILRPGDTLIVPGMAMQVYVLGGVMRPGPYSMPADARLLDAIAVAGGVAPTAQLDKAYVLRSAASDSEPASKQPVNLRTLLVDGDLSGNAELHAGDTLYVPARSPRGRSDLEKAMSLFAPFLYLLW